MDDSSDEGPSEELLEDILDAGVVSICHKTMRCMRCIKNRANCFRMTTFTSDVIEYNLSLFGAPSQGTSDVVGSGVKTSKKKFEVEAFLAIGIGKDMQPTVSVKYEEHDDPEWQPLDHMKKELTSEVFEELMRPLISGP